MCALSNLYRGSLRSICFFFFQAEDGIRDSSVTGVQTCALPIYRRRAVGQRGLHEDRTLAEDAAAGRVRIVHALELRARHVRNAVVSREPLVDEGVVRRVQVENVGIGRGAGWGRGEISVGAG